MAERQGAVIAVQNAFWRACEMQLYHHTNPWELDKALTDWGYAMGPCEAQDLVGLETVLMQAAPWPGPVLPRMVAEGRMGKIGGVGFYRYPGGGGAVIDPLLEDLILEEAWFAKVTRQELNDTELVARMNRGLRPVCENLRDQGMAETALRDCLKQAVHYPPNSELPV